MEQQKVFLACPTHDGKLHYKTAQRIYDTASRHHQLMISISQTSLLNWNCNQLWCLGLNAAQQHGMKWFAMLHSDVVPPEYWLDTLIEIAEANNAAMLSATIAIKDNGGDVSTGISNPLNNHWNLKRLTIEQCNALPETFDKLDVLKLVNTPFKFELLVNTGCMIVRVNEPWSELLIFNSEEHIRKDQLGQYHAYADPEDWNFSRQVAKHGRVMATRALHIDHIGSYAYPNQ